MRASQQLSKSRIIRKASPGERLIAAVVLLAVGGFIGFIVLSAFGKIDIGRLLPPCGFRQRWHLPCPTCGMTTAALAFGRGEVLKAFYIQPAAGLLCCAVIGVALIALVIAVFGVYFRFLDRFFAEVKARYIVLALLIIIAAGWVVTLSRELAARNGG